MPGFEPFGRHPSVTLLARGLCLVGFCSPDEAGRGALFYRSRRDNEPFFFFFQIIKISVA